MSDLVVQILIFVGVGVVFLLAALVTGSLLRPNKPSPEKGETYECGEPAVGDARGQFDLRFYVVALLFVVFDVEVAFFFPWAVVFGSANRAADAPPEAVAAELGELSPAAGADAADLQSAAETLAWLALADIGVFFGVLLVGFAYLWKRGDLDWVKSLAAQQESQSG